MADVTITLSFPGTYSIPVSFGTGTVAFVAAPQVFEEPGLEIPPVFGVGVASPEPISALQGLVFPLVFGTAAIVVQDPSVEPPPDPDPSLGVPGSVAPDASRPSGVVLASDIRVVG